MLQRILSGAIAVIVTAVAIYIDWLFILVVCLLTVGGLYEFFYMIKKKDIPIYSYTGIFIGLLIPLSIYWQFELTKNWELLLIVVASLLILLMQFARKDSRNAIVGLSTTMFGVFYVSWFLSFLIKIRMLLPGIEGVKLIAFFLLITKGGDIGALVFGKLWGKHALTPEVSPNKSVEGSLGSLFASAVIAVLASPLLPQLPHLSIIHMALMGCFFGALGQLGDLSESMIKRDCNLKDSGRVLPSLGGVLDMVDSLLFSAPAFYLYMNSALNSL